MASGFQPGSATGASLGAAKRTGYRRFSCGYQAPDSPQSQLDCRKVRYLSEETLGRCEIVIWNKMIAVASEKKHQLWMNKQFLFS